MASKKCNCHRNHRKNTGVNNAANPAKNAIRKKENNELAESTTVSFSSLFSSINDGYSVLIVFINCELAFPSTISNSIAKSSQCGIHFNASQA